MAPPIELPVTTAHTESSHLAARLASAAQPNHCWRCASVVCHRRAEVTVSCTLRRNVSSHSHLENVYACADLPSSVGDNERPRANASLILFVCSNKRATRPSQSHLNRAVARVSGFQTRNQGLSANLWASNCCFESEFIRSSNQLVSIINAAYMLTHALQASI